MSTDGPLSAIRYPVNSWAGHLAHTRSTSSPMTTVAPNPTTARKLEKLMSGIRFLSVKVLPPSVESHNLHSKMEGSRVWLPDACGAAGTASSKLRSGPVARRSCNGRRVHLTLTGCPQSKSSWSLLR